MPHCSLKIRSKKTCNSWQWIWSMFSVGFTLAVDSRVWLSPQSSSEGCRHSPPYQPPTGSLCPQPALASVPAPLGYEQVPACRDRGQDGWAPSSPQGLLQPIHGPHPSSHKQPSYPHVLWLSSVTAWCTAGHWCAASAFLEFLIGDVGNP